MSSTVGLGTPKFFIAIDFGTHGSGFAYSAASDGDAAVKTFEYWAGQRGQPAPKTRTALLYRLSDLSKPVAWGWEAVSQYADLPEDERAGFSLLESFKLYLMPEDFLGLPALPAGLTVRKLVADFLACLVGLIISTLEAHYGNRYRASAASWCMTVPAGLSQSSMTLMREAAMDAGIIPSLNSPLLNLATEPEAAALTVQQRKDLTGLSAGGKFMVINMGGGTVDMTIHKVDSVIGADMALTEVTHRECLAEGATRVDERFFAHLAQSLGADAYTDWTTDIANPEDLQDFKYMEWEACKCLFGSDLGSSALVQLTLPYSLVWAITDEARARLEEQRSPYKLIIPNDTMAGFFKPSLDSIAARAKEMLARAGGADSIMLVGGFSSSQHAIRYLRKELEAPCRPVIAPAYSRSAVLEGGVWYARYPAAIAARCSSMTYGVRTATRWQPGAPSKVWLPHKLAYRCVDGFTRYVAKDELVKSGSTISKSFVPLYPDQTRVAFDIYGCLQKSARYTTEETMMKVASVHIDLPPGSYADPDYYNLTAHFSFGEAQIAVRCVDEQSGNEQRTTLQFDSSEVSKEHLAGTFC